MEIKEILNFKKENIFDGAVQIVWFYEPKMRDKVASSYIFHGPKYYGMDMNDIKVNRHKLIDTASFIKTMVHKVYLDDLSNRFMLTIAGYGAGKSHLGVTMSSLLSGDDSELRTEILENIKVIDNDIYNELKYTINKPNLVISLNGMNDFNLNNEILKNAKKALALHGYDDSVLQEISTSYKTAENFLNSLYDNLVDKYEKIAMETKKYRLYKGSKLKDKLRVGIYEDKEAFDIVNKVYKEVTGNNIRWDDGISANNILLKLNEYYCEQNKIFNKIIIIFDEFGRFLEYASNLPTQAGDSALQQIFEAIQNADKNIIFLGFIQSDLSAYISRVDNPNIKRYVSRYDTSDKYYLSSNLETVLANLIGKNDPNGIIDGYIERKYKNYNEILHGSINRWIKESNNKSVWKNKNLYKKVILKGCYPFHPITVWLLSNLSTWMQQRSTLNVASEIFENYASKEIYDEGLTYIYPIEVIKSKIFTELLDAEEKGLQQSQFCIMYNEIMIKYSNKLTELQIDMLQGILIASICRCKMFDKNENISFIKYCTGYKQEDIESALDELEEDFGIIRYDRELNMFEFITEATGKNEFKNEFIRIKKQISTDTYMEIIDDSIKEMLGLNTPSETIFDKEHSITTKEWYFDKKIVHINEINKFYFKHLMMEQEDRVDISDNKGILVYVYTDQQSYMNINEVQRLIKDTGINNYPILFILINDHENIIKNRLIDIKVLKSFSASKQEQFEKFIKAYNENCIKELAIKFKKLELEKQFITIKGVEPLIGRLSNICNNKFEEVYTKIVPFVFDGYERGATKANSNLFSICKGLINNTITKKEGFLNLTKEEQNRAKSVLMISNNNSWKVMNSEYLLLEPQQNELLEIYNEVIEKLGTNKVITLNSLFRKYIQKPYTMNMSSLTLFICYIIGYTNSNLNIYDSKGLKVKNAKFAQEIFDKSKIDLKKIFQYSIEYIEGSKEDVYTRLVDKINNNVYVENCQSLEIELVNLEEEEDIPESLNTKITLAKMRLEAGKSLYKQIYNQLEESKKVYQESSTKSFNMQKLVRVYKNLSNYNRDKLDMNYQYKQEYIDNCESLLEKIDLLIENNVSKFINSINSSYPEKFYRNEMKHKITIKLLKEIGKNKIADKLENHLITVEKELLVAKKYQEALSKLDNDYNKIEDSIIDKNYNKLEASIEKINQWTKFFKSNKELTPSLIDANIEKLNDFRIKVGKELDNIDDYMKLVKDNVKYIETIQDIKDLKERIDNISYSIKDSKYEKIINPIKDVLENAIIDFNEIRIGFNDRSFLEGRFIEIQNKYSKTILDKVMENQRKEIEKNLSKLENNYINTIKKDIISKVNELNYRQCIEYINKLSNIPIYISTKGIKEIDLMLDLLQDRLNDNKIDTIMSMFTELDKNSQKKCINMLEDIFN